MTKLKICGVRRLQEVELVNVLKPDYVGFVFAPSKRQVTLAEAAELRQHLNPDICPVGVFVDAQAEEIIRAVSSQTICSVQLHGKETVEQVAALKRQLPATVSIVKAIRMERSHRLELWQDSVADYLLLDAGAGGMGVAFNHNLIPNAGNLRKPWFLAGGMHPNNVQMAIRQFHPFGIDVSSGVETDGYKDPEKMRNMIRRVRYE